MDDLEGSLSIRETIVVKDPPALARHLGTETLLVTGSPRGATSMVAYALLRGGYPLSTTPGALNHEDQRIAEARQDAERLRALIASGNAGASRWGFKLPHAARHLRWYADHLRNPVFVVIYRNPLAVARSILSHHRGWPQSLEGLERALRHGLTSMTQGTEVLSLDVPALLLDVDVARTEPSRFVRELLSLLRLDVSEERVGAIAEEIATGGYKHLSEP